LEEQLPLRSSLRGITQGELTATWEEGFGFPGDWAGLLM